MSETAPVEAPPRGTRPRNRRELIRDAAASLFAERGYAQVALRDVAATVNIGESAIYRHYSSKAELLYDAVDSALDRVADLPGTDGMELADCVAALVANIVDHRAAGVLWQRESRNLPDPERATLRRKVRLVNSWLAAELQARRPELESGQAELLASCAIDAATSISFHQLALPRTSFAQLLTRLCLRVLDLEPDPTSEPSRRRNPRPPGSRSDQLIDASMHLFARHGYAAVSIDDIGAAVGIAGPSVYKHFDSKHALLLAGMERGEARLRRDFARASAADVGDEEILRRASAAYVSVTLEHGDQIATLIGETIHLSEPDRHRIREMQREFVDDWVALLRAYRPDNSATVARIKVHAALMVSNDVARTPHLHQVPGFRQTLLDACWAVQQ